MTAPDPAPAQTSPLREYLGVLRIRKWSIIIITIIGLLAATEVARKMPKVFTSTAQVIVVNPIAQFQQQSGNNGGLNMATEVSVVTSNTVQNCAYLLYQTPTGTADKVCTSTALANVKTLPDWFTTEIAVTNPQLTQVLQIGVTDESKTVAQKAAQAYADAYVWYKVSNARTYVENLRSGPLASEARLEKSISSLQAKVAKDIAKQNQQAFQSDNSRLVQDNANLIQVQQTLSALDPGKIQSPEIALAAPLPSKSSNGLTRKLALVAGLLIGLALGIAQAFLRHRLDTRIRGRGDLEAAAGAPVLAAIPRVSKWRSKRRTHLAIVEDPGGGTAEAYRTLRTGILYATTQADAHAILVASPTAGEGKTTTAANLAVALAEADKRVILVSADLRKPRVAKFLGLKDEPGLSDVLTGKVELPDALQATSVKTLRLLGSGHIPANPSEMLQSDAMRELIAGLRSIADYVIIDTTPVLLVSDARALAPFVDGILLVADATTTTEGAVLQTREELSQVNGRIIGAVLNNFDPSKTMEYTYPRAYYSRRYRYAHRAPRPRRPGQDRGRSGAASSQMWTASPPVGDVGMVPVEAPVNPEEAPPTP